MQRQQVCALHAMHRFPTHRSKFIAGARSCLDATGKAPRGAEVGPLGAAVHREAAVPDEPDPRARVPVKVAVVPAAVAPAAVVPVRVNDDLPRPAAGSPARRSRSSARRAECRHSHPRAVPRGCGRSSNRSNRRHRQPQSSRRRSVCPIASRVGRPLVMVHRASGQGGADPQHPQHPQPEPVQLAVLDRRPTPGLMAVALVLLPITAAHVAVAARAARRALRCRLVV